MTYEEALEAFQKAQEATQKAKQKVREAQSHLQKMEDAQRESWVRLQDALRLRPPKPVRLRTTRREG